MSARIIQVRPSRNPRWKKQGGWEVFEAEGVCPVYCGATGREYAMYYAKQRAGYAPTRIEVLDSDWSIADPRKCSSTFHGPLLRPIHWDGSISVGVAEIDRISWTLDVNPCV